MGLLFYLGGSWGSLRMVVVDVSSVFLLGELLFLTGPQGVKDQSSQQVLVLPVSEGPPPQLVNFSLGSEPRARGVPFFSIPCTWVGGAK